MSNKTTLIGVEVKEGGEVVQKEIKAQPSDALLCGVQDDLDDLWGNRLEFKQLTSSAKKRRQEDRFSLN